MLIEMFVDIVFGLGLFINAALFIPQAIKLYRTKDSSEHSLITFAGFNIIQVFMFWHGYLHKDYIFVIGSLACLITCGGVTFLIWFYRKNNVV